MTNATIILNESFRLMKEGILSGSGRYAELEDGSQVELPEDIHTFNYWKSCGFSVKKGEHAIAKFPIWKHTTKKIKVPGKDIETGETVETETDSSRMFMKVSAFFKFSQVEPLKC